jgi:hypothetical protein
MDTMQPSQLNPIYPLRAVGLSQCGLEQPSWSFWNAQVEPFPAIVQRVIWFPPVEEQLDLDLASYIEITAGTAADLDPALETATIEHLLRDDQAERQ